MRIYFVKNVANADFILEEHYKFDACNFAEYHGYDYLATEFFRLVSDIEVCVQNTGIAIKGYQAVSAKGIRHLAYEEYIKFLQAPENYQLPKGLHKNIQKVLEQCVCKIDFDYEQIMVIYQESNEYYRNRLEIQKQIKMFTGNEERFSETKAYPVSQYELKEVDTELAKKQMQFMDIISLSKQQQNDLTSFEELCALYKINGNHTKEDEMDLQGYNSANDDFDFARLDCK